MNKKLVIFYLLILVLLILSLIFSILDLVKRHSLDILLSLKNDMNKKPIFSLSVSKENCENKLTIGEFPGTSKGCNCLGRNGHRLESYERNRITKNSCSRNQSNSGCEDIDSIDKYDFNIWDSNYFCVDNNINNYIYYLNNSVGEGEKCPLNFKKCGILDTLNNILCIEDNLDCPINKLIINNKNSYSENNINFKTLSLNNNKFLHYSNEFINDKIITNFQLSEGGFPCYNPLRYNTAYPQYILLNNFNEFMCIDKFNGNFYDERYQLIDSISKKTLYTENGNLFNILIEKGGYPKFNFNTNINLYVRNYIGIRKNCVFREENFISIEKIEKMKKDHKISNNINIACLVITVILILLYFICLILFHSNNYTDRYFMIFNSILLFLDLSNLILGFLSAFYLHNININNSCYDEIMNFFIKNAKDDSRAEKNYCTLFIIFVFCVIILNIILILLLYDIFDKIIDCICYKYNDNKNKKVIDNNNSNKNNEDLKRIQEDMKKINEKNQNIDSTYSAVKGNEPISNRNNQNVVNDVPYHSNFENYQNHINNNDVPYHSNFENYQNHINNNDVPYHSNFQNIPNNFNNEVPYNSNDKVNNNK